MTKESKTFKALDSTHSAFSLLYINIRKIFYYIKILEICSVFVIGTVLPLSFIEFILLKMAGRRGAVDQGSLWDVFSSFESDIIKEDRVAVPKSEIWESINAIFPLSNPKALYTAALRWYEKIREKKDVSELCYDDFEEISMEESENASTSINTTVSLNSERINFNIYLSPEVWKSISPVPVCYNRKTELALL